MSRLLKQVYSQNVYVEFRFQSSLRKYDKKPTKKIKCEAYCKHCINHQKRLEESPFRQSKMRFESQSKLRKFYQNSLEKRSEKSIISPCKTIKLSKQKVPLSEKQDINALQMNIYRGLLSQEKNGEAVLQKSQENNSSSIQDEVFLNEFEHNSQDQAIKEVILDEDFNKIQLPQLINIENKLKCSEIIQNQKQNQCNLEQNQQKIKQNNIQNEQIIEQQQSQQILDEKVQIYEKLNEIINENFIQQMKQSNKYELIIEEPFQQKEVIIADSQQVCQQNLPIYFEQLLLRNKTSLNSQASQIIQNHSNQKMIEESCLGESLMDKCLAFQGGRIYVDTSGQNFYISVRVFNKLRRRCSDIEELTSVLIHQRPYLQSKKEQIKQQLQEYLKTFA